ncbi:MAG: carbonic anhydrase [Moheibacter sp.]
MILDKIFENNEKWIAEKTEKDATYFENLNKGQKPDVLYIGCSDSRVTAEDIMGLQPGELFVHRNIANIVNAIDMNAQSVINYAVTNLEVNHVVVCGHYSCGGVKAAMQAQDLGILNPWLRNIRDVYRTHKEELNSIGDEHKRYDRLVELNVKEQAINVVKMAAVQKAMKKRNLKIHGWVFDIQTGKLIDLNINFDKILDDIMEIYKLEN